jgi:hypothetical protein
MFTDIKEVTFSCCSPDGVLISYYKLLLVKSKTHLTFLELTNAFQGMLQYILATVLVTPGAGGGCFKK